MFRRQRQIRTQVHQIVDAGLFGVSLWLAHLVRVAAADLPLWPALGGEAQIEAFYNYIWLYFLILPFGPLLLDLQGFYLRPLLPKRRETAWPLFRACALAVVGVILVMFLMKVQLARSVIILFGGISFLLIMAKEELLRAWLQSRLGQAQLTKRVILVGQPTDTDRLRVELKRQAPHDIEVLGQLDLNETPVGRLVDLMHATSANCVIVSGKHTYFGEIEKAIEVCEREGVELWLLADFFKTQVSHTATDEFFGRPSVVFRCGPEASWQRFAKDIIDLAGALVLVALFSPVFLIVSLLLKLTSPGPVFFRQQRSGLNGKPFTMLKFRTMVSNAEQLKHELAALNEMSGPVFKLSNDPRVTPVGRFLRRFSIDELPQLFNVLGGEMSLVGPRPLPVDEVERFDDPAHRRRLSVRPGMTCLWQVSGRNQVSSFQEWVRLDLDYIDHWSLWLDFKILLRTIPAVLSGIGAK
jgi:exopolysaccharide biosynthesis polyprenyl glycosylphosphotransferase